MKNDNIKNFSFRDLSINDVDLLFEWINDVDARNFLFNPRSINKKDHINWFKRIINSKNVYIWIFLKNNEDFGFVRFEKQKLDKFKFSYFLKKSARGFGYSSIMIEMSLEKFCSIKLNIRNKIIAKTLSTNIFSIKSLKKSGFVFLKEKNNTCVFDFECNKNIINENR